MLQTDKHLALLNDTLINRDNWTNIISFYQQWNSVKDKLVRAYSI